MRKELPLGKVYFRQVGISLIELMIAMALGLILLAGLTGLVVEQSTTRSELEKTTQQIENGRYAEQLLRDDIEHAGFYGEYYTVETPPGTLPDPCDTALATLKIGFTLPIQGYNSPTTSPITCIAAANHKAGTDILVVRRADSNIATATAVGQVYLQSTADAYVLGTSAATLPAGGFTLKKKDGTTAADRRKYHVHIYYISPCSVPTSGATCSTNNTDDGGVSIPTLKRLELTVSSGATSLTTMPLVEGIENMQVDYGVDTTNDGSPDGDFVTNPGTTASWQNVAAISLNLLARNTEQTQQYTDTKTYSLGKAGLGAACAANPHPNSTACPHYKRHAYSSIIRVVNPSSRKETP